MNSSPSPALPPMQPSVRPRRWPRIVLLFAVIALMPVAWYAYSVFATRNAWADAEAETDRLDPGWRFADMEAGRKTVPDAENSALHINAVWRKGGVIGVRGMTYDAIFRVPLHPYVQLNGQQTAFIRGELAKTGNRLQQARRLKDMPNGRFPIKDVMDFITNERPSRNVRNIVDEWLVHDAWLLAQDQEYDLAIESCQACVMASRATAGEPSLYSHFGHTVTREVAIGTLERVLAQGEASEARLRTLQALLEEEMNSDGWLSGVRGERAANHFFFENLRDGSVDSDLLRRSGYAFAWGPADPPTISDWLVKVMPSSVVRHYPGYLRFMNQFVEIAKVPIHERGPKLEEWETQYKSSSNPLIRMTVSRYAGAGRSKCLYEARVRTAAVALACERYRLKHKAWPATLDVLVQMDLLKAIPTDPIDNQPLRYNRKADGIVVYSINLDRIDDQGYFDYTIENFKIWGPGADVGFRLWNVPSRRQPPLAPAVAIEPPG